MGRSTKLTFSTKVILALVLGLFTGLFFGEKVAWFNMLGTGFIKLLQISVIPYIILSLVTGLGALNYKQIRNISLKFIIVLVVFWGLGLVVIFAMTLAFPFWQSAEFFSASQIITPPAVNYFDQYIPSNPFRSLSETIVPAIVVFSLFLGIAIIDIGNKDMFLNPARVLLKAFTNINSAVIKILPLGIFVIAAAAAGTIQAEEFEKLQIYFLVFIISSLVLSFWVLPFFVSVVTPFRYSDIVKGCRDLLVTAFVTGNLFILLPVLVESCNQIVHKHQKLTGTAGKYIEIIVPIAFNFPGIGKLLLLLFILFSAWFTGNEFTLTDNLNLIFNGIFSLFASVHISLPFLLNEMGLPADMYQLFLGGDVITRRFKTLTAAVSLLTLTLTVTAYLEDFGKINFRRLLVFVASTFIVVSVMVMACQYLFSHIVDKERNLSETLDQMQVNWQAPQEIKVEDLSKRKLQSRPSTPLEIVRLGKLRVGYDPARVPFSYFNRANNLIGFDVEMMNYLATSLGVTLEMIPFVNRASLFIALENHQIDIVISAVQISEKHLAKVLYTQPIIDLTSTLVVPDSRKKEFSNYSVVEKMEKLKLATLGHYPRIDYILRKLKNVEIEKIASADDFFENDDHGYDAFITSLEVGMTLVMLYPEYAVALDKSRIFRFPIGYAVASDNLRLQALLNSWLDIQKSSGRIDKLYDYWIQGKGAKVIKPRWSILENVLRSRGN